jgi:hypothetical protein
MLFIVKLNQRRNGMNGLDNHYANMLADHQRMLDEQAQKEEEMDSFKDKIALLLEENHPAELERLTGVDDTTCKKVVHQLYMEGFNDQNCWEPERVGNIWVIFGKNFSGEWIDENGDYVGFETRNEADQYIKETFK